MSEAVPSRIQLVRKDLSHLRNDQEFLTKLQNEYEDLSGDLASRPYDPDSIPGVRYTFKNGVYEFFDKAYPYDYKMFIAKVDDQRRLIEFRSLKSPEIRTYEYGTQGKLISYTTRRLTAIKQVKATEKVFRYNEVGNLESITKKFYTLKREKLTDPLVVPLTEMVQDSNYEYIEFDENGVPTL